MERFKKMKMLTLFILALGFSLASWSHVAVPEASAADVTLPTVTTEAWIPDDRAAPNYIPNSGVVNLDDIDEVGEYFTVYSNASDISGIFNHKVKMQVGAMTVTLIDCWDANSDGYCDFMGDIRITDLRSDSTGNIVAQLQVSGGSFSDGDVVSYWSEATDTVLPVGNTGSSVAQSFTVREMKTWAKAYGGNVRDEAQSIQQTSDGGYITAGWTRSYGTTNSYDFLILKLKNDGDQEWAKIFGDDSEDDSAYFIQQTDDDSDGQKDDGYIVAGETESYGAGIYDFLILKLDSSGNQQWAKTFGEVALDRPFSIQQTTDGGYVISGKTSSYGAGSYDFLILKLDSSGNQQWAKTFGRNGADGSCSVQQTSDGGYIIAGMTGSWAGFADNLLVLRLDSNGEQKWAESFGGLNNEYAYSIQQTNDGGYIVSGFTSSYGAGSDNALIIKINPDIAGAFGGVNWAKTFGGIIVSANSEYADSIQQTTDGGYVIAGITCSYGSCDFLVLKLDSGGVQEWARTFGHDSNTDWAKSVRQTDDGGYIITGKTSLGAGNYDYLVLKLDQNGNMVNCSPPLANLPADVIVGPGCTPGSLCMEDVAGKPFFATLISKDILDPGCTANSLCSEDINADLDGSSACNAGELCMEDINADLDGSSACNAGELCMEKIVPTETDVCISPNASPVASIVCNPASCQAYAFNGTNDSYCSDCDIDLENASTDNPDCLTGIPCAGLGFSSCNWNVAGTPTATCNNITESLSVGNHTADLTVTDQGGLSDAAPQKILTFQQDIYANFECSTDGGVTWEDCDALSAIPIAGDTIHFRAVSGGALSSPSVAAALTNYNWDFGDSIGTANTDPTSYAYALNGTYSVTLVITDSAGRQAERSYNITIGSAAPTIPKWNEVSPGE